LPAPQSTKKEIGGRVEGKMGEMAEWRGGGGGKGGIYIANVSPA